MLPSEVKYKHLKEGNDQDFKNLFPDFVWVLHDFSLSKTFKHCTAESYLQQCLDIEKLITDDAHQKN